MLVNSGVESARVTLTARTFAGGLLEGDGIINPVTMTLSPSSSRTLRAKEIFGASSTLGWVQIQTVSSAVSGTFSLSDTAQTSMDGGDLSMQPASRLVFPNVSTNASFANRLAFVNTSDSALSKITISLFEDGGRLAAQRDISLDAFAGFSGAVSDLVPNVKNFDGYAVVETTNPALIGFEIYREKSDIAALGAVSDTKRLKSGYLTQFGNSQNGMTSTLVLVNYGNAAQTVTITAAVETKGATSVVTVQKALAANERMESALDRLLGINSNQSNVNFVRFDAQQNSAGVLGYLETKTPGGALTATAPQASGYSDITISNVMNGPDTYTGLTLQNPGSTVSAISIDVFDARGYSVDSATLTVGPNSRWSGLLTELLPGTANQTGGRVHITASSLILAIQVIGSISTGAMTIVPVQGAVLSSQTSGQIVSAVAGGMVLSTDGSSSLSIPPSALDHDSAVRITPLNPQSLPKPPHNEHLMGVVEGTPDGTQFRIPVRLRFPLSEAMDPGSSIDLLILNNAANQWEPSEFTAIVEPSGRMASADVTHFTKYGVGGATSVKITGLNPASGAIGASVTISGSGFASTVAGNTVLFTTLNGGTLPATILTASTTTLTTKVPVGAVTGKIYVKVGSVTSVGKQFTVTTSTNLAPVISAGPDETVTLPSGGILSASATDDGLPTGSSLTSNWAVINGPGSVTFGDAKSLSTPASFSSAGTYYLRATATDGVLSSSDDVVVNVTSGANQPPLASAGLDQRITLPSSAALTGTASDDGLPDGTLNAQWTKISGPGDVTFSNAAAFTTTASFATAGTYTLRLTASDGALSSTDDVNIVVNPATINQPPVVFAGANQKILLPAAANLSGTVTDDGIPSGTVTTTWKKYSGPGTVTFANAAALSTTATFSVAGTYVLQLSATDGILASSAFVTIVAIPSGQANQAPVVKAGPAQTVTMPQAAFLLATVNDDGLPAGSSVTTTWSKVSGPGTVTFGTSTSLQTTATFSAAGTYVLRATASDSALSGTSDVSVVVIAAGSAAQHWGFSNTDAESVMVASGALAMDGQSSWFYYNGGDATEGAYMGWLYQYPSLAGTVHLPKTLAPGRYYVFFRGTAYDSNLSVQAKIGAAVSTSVVADDRDANGDWTDRAVIDVTASSSDVVVNIIRNPAVAVDQKYLFRGIYITTNDKESVDRYSTALKLIYPTVMDDSAAVKGNLINDSGFETGIDASWGFDGRRTEPPIWDNTQAYEGRSSMKVSLDHYANAYGDNMGLVSRIYHLKPNKKYTVSMWAKTSPGQTVAIRLDLTNTFTPPAGYPTQPVVGSFIYATDTWQRISATGYALQYPTSDYQIHLMSNELSGGYLWIDGVQLEEGDISNYQPASPVVAGVMINDQPGNVFYEDEAIAGDLLVRNNLTTQAAPIVRYEIYDFMNQLVRRGSEDFTLPAQTTQQVAFSLSTGKRGIFRIVTWVDGMEHTSKEISYSVIPRPAVTGLDPDSFLGVHPNYTESELSILEKLGIKWARALSPSGFYRWSVIEPVEGQFYWYDADIQRAAAHGITTLGTIGTNNYWPGWADNGGLPDLAKWQTFVGQLAEHYRDSVQYWEIWNEPHSVFTADFYAQMLKLAVDAIEVNNPNAKIVGMGGVPLSYMNAVIAAMQSRYPTWDWKQHIHVLSTHNYPDGEPPESFKPNITDNYGIPVWNTESGSWDRGFYQGPNSNFTAWGKNLWPYADASRYYYGMLGSPNSIVQNFLRTIASGQQKYFYYDSRAAASPDYLRGHTTFLEYDGTIRAKGIAYAIAGALVDHSTGLGNVSDDTNSTFLLFDKADGPIAALYAADKKPRQITLSLNAGDFQVLDMMGNPIAIVGSTIPYGRIPVYVKANGITAAALKSALQAGTIAARNDTLAPNVSISDAPVGSVSGGVRVRWIAVDDTSYPNLGEINPESNVASESPDPEAILYSYFLEGYSTSWSKWTSGTYVDFTVPAGSYNFCVVAKDSAGNVSQIASRPIVIVP